MIFKIKKMSQNVTNGGEEKVIICLGASTNVCINIQDVSCWQMERTVSQLID